MVDSRDPESAWKNFKTVLFALVDKHIPKITIKSDFIAPLFDADCLAAYRKKERAHKKFKCDSSLSNELKRVSTPDGLLRVYVMLRCEITSTILMIQP